jgi:16S rRNA (guanine527-N7)-methyltransferase
MTINEFVSLVSKLNINLTDEIVKKLNTYYEELVDYNSKTNLTTITNKDDVFLKHFYDSLTIVKAYDFNKEVKVLDIGSGAGFPGLVLKIVFPNIRLVLLDSNNKKTMFLEQVINKLELKDVIVVNKRAEEYIKENRESFDIVTSRAVAKIRILCEIGLPYLKNNGLFIMMKGSNLVTESEVEEASSTLKVLNSKIDNQIRFKLPIEESERNIVVIKKEKEISDIYPRSYDKILKKPLK